MKKDLILLVEDDSTLSFIVEDALKREGFEVVTALDGAEGLDKFKAFSPDLIIADVMMRKLDGFEMVKRIRLADANVPVLFLTARSALDDVVNGFELGGNDYLRKPFQIAELVVRIKALLKRRHRQNAEDAVVAIGDCRIDFATQILTVNGHGHELSHIEAVILNKLFSHPNEVVEARTLMFRIWENDDYNNLNRLHGFIYKLRKYLAPSTTTDILNVRGIGYKLTAKS